MIQDSNNVLIAFSSVSTHSDGRHMLPLLDQLHVDVACVGQNDVGGRGLAGAQELFAQTKCPWVLSNVIDKTKEGKPVCGVEEYFVIEKFGCKIGVVGLAEEAMLDQLSHDVDSANLEHLDCSEKF